MWASKKTACIRSSWKKNEINERACARARAFPLAFQYDRIDSNEIPCSITGNIGDENVFANIQIVHKQVIIVWLVSPFFSLCLY